MNLDIGRVRGNGFFCTVMKATNEQGDTVALKQLKKEFCQNPDYIYRFKREVSLLKQLDGCPHIVSCLDSEIDEEKQIFRYTMPLADYNLHQYLMKNNNQLDLVKRLEIFDQILEAIRFAHSKTILHRDLAPNNVLVFEENDIQIKLSDFGLGKDHQSLSMFTKTTGSYGQILYVAPEQHDNLNNASERSDVYSLGKILYFVLTNKMPTTITSSTQFSSIIQKAIQDDPADRFDSVEAFKEQYEKMKSLYLNMAKPSRYETVERYLEENKSNIDWAEFHGVVLQGKVIDHVYYDYLDPIVDTIFDWNSFINYKHTLNDDMMPFLKIFSEKLHECYGKTGWPFTSMNRFGSFFMFMYNNVTNPEEKLHCLKELWDIAIEHDQWGPQDDLNKLLRGNVHPEIIIPFSEFLMGSSSRFAEKILTKGNLKNMDQSIRNAIHQIVERYNETSS